MSSQSAPGLGKDRITLLFLLLTTALAVASFLVRTIVDSDTWWQVAIGRDILARLEVPRVDHFAAAAFGRPYHDSHWLFQVVLALADKVAGMAAVGLASAALWGAAFACCYRAMRRWLAPAPCAPLLFLAVIACSDRFIPRPEVVTYLMVAAFYLLLQQKKYFTVPHLAGFAVLQAVWANSHGLFVIGPFLACCYLIDAYLARRQDDGAELRATLKLVGVLLAASLATPFGINGWRYALLLLSEVGAGAPSLFKGLVELTPTFGEVARAFPDFWFYLLLLILLILTTVPALLKRSLSWSRLLIVVALLAASVSGRRNIPLLALTAAPLVAENLFRIGVKAVFPAAAQVALAIALLAASWLPVSGRYYEAFHLPVRFGLGMSRDAYSTRLPGFLRKMAFSGVVYAPPYLGGYTLYHGFTPMVDGRWEVYDMANLDKMLRARFDQRIWNGVVAAYDIKGVMVGYGEYDTEHLLQRLASDPRFRQVYSDEAASFWIRVY